LNVNVNAGRQHMSDTGTRVSIIVGVCQRDPERWREFDSIYRPILRAYLRKRGLKDTEAEDVVQVILMKLVGKIHTYDRSRCRFRTWLFSVAQHTLIDDARRQASYKKALDGWAGAVLRASPSESAKMEEEWLRIHREEILAHALKVVRARVSSKAWACFEQRLLRDRPAAEIARELGIAPNAVFVNACRVLKQVRAFCDEFDEDISHAFESDLPE
jgi:RNA polymerase sigma factor (sigma-70 family)